MKTTFPVELQHLQTNVQLAAGLLRVLANEHRLGVLCALPDPNDRISSATWLAQSKTTLSPFPRVRALGDPC